jgi:hypothetical protein
VKVLIIPEDQELDRYIVKPVIEAMFAELGLKGRVDVLPEPRLRGATQALDRNIVAEIVRENPMIDLFLLIVDADCDREGNHERAAARAAESTRAGFSPVSPCKSSRSGCSPCTKMSSGRRSQKYARTAIRKRAGRSPSLRG